ncbi:response regulator [Thermodesulfobacteriota bacterium]
MAEQKRIFIAEDHRILRDGLKALIAARPDYCVAGEAADGFEAIQGVKELLPDLVLLDLSMPKLSGLHSIKEIKRAAPEAKVLVLTVHRVEEYIVEALRAGADGYALKSASYEELMVAVENVLNGGSYLSPGISRQVIEGFLQTKKPVRTGSALSELTEREQQVLKLIAEGFKNRDIAGQLYISVKTVETHRSNILKKLDLHSAAELTTFALQNKLIGNE